MDTKNSVFLAFLTLSAISFSSIFAAQNTNSQIQAPSPTPFPVCIDDSDCVKLGKGDKFACFQYICYPWKNDDQIDPKNRRKLAGKMMIVTRDKSVSDITTNAWLIEASALTRWKVAKKQKIAANLTNVAAELAVKPSTTQNLPNYHAFLT